MELDRFANTKLKICIEVLNINNYIWKKLKVSQFKSKYHEKCGYLPVWTSEVVGFAVRLGLGIGVGETVGRSIKLHERNNWAIVNIRIFQTTDVQILTISLDTFFYKHRLYENNKNIFCKVRQQYPSCSTLSNLRSKKRKRLVWFCIYNVRQITFLWQGCDKVVIRWQLLARNQISSS